MERDLAQKITEAATEYYNGRPTMTDSEFDALVDELRNTDPSNPVLSTTGWGYVPTNTHLDKFPHSTHVGSLSKIKMADAKAGNARFEGPFVASMKLDGGSAVAYYDNGKLVRVLSRGDGDVGLDITANMLHCVPSRISDTSVRSVRGEILISHESFQEINGTSPRNRAVGLSQSVNVPASLLTHLKFIAYDIPEYDRPLSKQEILDILYRCDFIVVPFSNWETWDEFVAFFGTKLDILVPTEAGQVQVDGIVLTKSDNSSSIAVKFEDDRATTTVVNVQWNVSRTGRLVPVAVVEPVMLAGARISRITLNNLAWALDRGIGVGAEVEVVRSNMVIPMVVSVLKPGELHIPQNCPVCETELVSSGRDLKCDNKSCATRMDGVLWRIWGEVGVDGIGATHITTLCDHFGIDSLSSLRSFLDSVEEVDIEAIFGPATAAKVLELLAKLRAFQPNPGTILWLANIPSLGGKACDKFAADITPIEFVSTLAMPRPPSSWAAYMNRPAFVNLSSSLPLVRELVLFVGPQNLSVVPKSAQIATKVKVCITGALSMPRPKLLQELAPFGIQEVGIGQADVLICDKPSDSNKYLTAVTRKIRIMTEDAFRAEFMA